MKLLDTNPLDIINYIKSSIEILLSMKEEELDYIKKEKQEKILKLKTKMKKIQSEHKPKPKKGFTYQIQKKSKINEEIHDGSSLMRNSSYLNSSKESGFRTFLFDPPQEYEDMICKLESDVRKHIRT